ncbi:MAG: helix-turn-helix domain-containing protein [Planctomycetaceae bacterium]|nr:helix-turn-helix domain-containing protein [Planctomycetaceae bacterium]
MDPRALEILARLETIDMESMALRKELRKILEAGKRGGADEAAFSMFKGTTRRLLTELLHAPNNMLSYDDIRLDVMLDEDVSNSAVRSVIKRARQEMRDWHGCPYEIKSIAKKGYKLERKKCQTVLESHQEHGKTRHSLTHLIKYNGCPCGRSNDIQVTCQMFQMD